MGLGGRRLSGPEDLVSESWSHDDCKTRPIDQHYPRLGLCLPLLRSMDDLIVEKTPQKIGVTDAFRDRSKRVKVEPLLCESPDTCLKFLKHLNLSFINGEMKENESDLHLVKEGTTNLHRLAS